MRHFIFFIKNFRCVKCNSEINNFPFKNFSAAKFKLLYDNSNKILEQIKRIIDKYFEEHKKISQLEPKNEDFVKNNEILKTNDKNKENFIEKTDFDMLINEENNMVLREKEETSLLNTANIEIKIALERSISSKSAKIINKFSELKKELNLNEKNHIFGLKNVGNSC